MKKLLSVVFAVAMMFVLAISASAKDVDTENSFNDSMNSSKETHIRLTSDIYAAFYPDCSKEIDLNGHVLTINDARTHDIGILVVKNGVIQSDDISEMIELTAVDFIVFENVTIHNALLKLQTKTLILNNVTFDKAQGIVYGARQISYDSNEAKSKGNIGKFGNMASSLAENILSTNGGSFGLDEKGTLKVSHGNLELYKIMVGGVEESDLVDAIAGARHEPVELLWKNNDNIILRQEGKEALSVPVVPGTLHPESIPMPTIEKAGYCFAGWLDSDGNKLTMDSVITTAATYDAKWSPEKNVLPDLAKAMLELGFSQSRVDQITSLISSSGLVGSALTNGPVWGIVIVALMFGCFAGGLAFGKKKK